MSTISKKLALEIANNLNRPGNANQRPASLLMGDKRYVEQI
jgi:hypothetical protein